MAASRYRLSVTICLIVFLTSQTWSGSAYNNQKAKWLTTDLSQRRSERVFSRPDRHLQESKSTTAGKIGYRAALVNEDHKLHNRWGLSGVERIYRASQKSISRALYLDSKARAATYYSATSTIGRKALQVVAPAPAPSSFESEVEATPGSYSMAFSIGTPPQNFVAIADTGSDLVWLQCAACTVCFNQSSPGFQPGNSSTYQPLGCSGACSELGTHQLQCAPSCLYNYTYGDMSTTAGDYSTDIVTLGTSNSTVNSTTNSTLIPLNFGCGLQNNGTFTDTDGIVGLARGPISFPSQIAPYLNNQTKFSYCLVSTFENSTVMSPIIFGEAAVPTNLTELVYTPLLTPYNVSVVPYYYVNLQGISVGGVNVSVPITAFQIDDSGNGGTLFDSGTTYTALTDAAYVPVLNAIRDQIGTTYPRVDLSQVVGLDLCYDITGEVAVEFPTLTFQFENADFDLPFDNIVVLVGDTQTTYMCVAMTSSPGMSIFGNTQQQNFQLVYEVDALRIGWKPEDCATL